MQFDRPLIFVDLDDTLFQTARKMPQDSPRHTATLDVSGQPNGFMNNVQKAFVDWLLLSADVVPVTARSTEVFKRVRLPFCHGAVCSHGGIILQPDGRQDPAWAEKMTAVLTSFQHRLHELVQAILLLGQDMGLSLRSWVVEEGGIGQYVVTKHNGSDDSVLTQVLSQAQTNRLLGNMHVHANGNNLAFLPMGLAKKYAVEEWLHRDRMLNGARPVLGLGDSVTDLGFMKMCDFWATPAKSQLAALVEERCHD